MSEPDVNPFPAGLPIDPVARAVAVLIMQGTPDWTWASMLDWAGLLGGPLPSDREVRAKYGLHRETYRKRKHRVRSIAAGLAIPDAVADEASAQSTDPDEHETRWRWAWLLNCTPPEPPQPSIADHRMARQAAEILAAVGPMTIDDLAECVRRPQARRGRQVDPYQLAAALVATRLARVDHRGRWTHAATVAARTSHLALLREIRFSGRAIHSYAELCEAFKAVGLSPRGPTLYNHPLLRHVGRDRWAVVVQPEIYGQGGAS